jgi:hypothetical protein
MAEIKKRWPTRTGSRATRWLSVLIKAKIEETRRDDEPRAVSAT